MNHGWLDTNPTTVFRNSRFFLGVHKLNQLGLDVVFSSFGKVLSWFYVFWPSWEKTLEGLQLRLFWNKLLFNDTTIEVRWSRSLSKICNVSGPLLYRGQFKSIVAVNCWVIATSAVFSQNLSQQVLLWRRSSEIQFHWSGIKVLFIFGFQIRYSWRVFPLNFLHLYCAKVDFISNLKYLWVNQIHLAFIFKEVRLISTLNIDFRSFGTNFPNFDLGCFRTGALIIFFYFWLQRNFVCENARFLFILGEVWATQDVLFLLLLLLNLS